MTKAANRAQNVQTPGAEASEELDTEAQGQEEQAALAPDLQALVQMEVAKLMAQANKSRAAPGTRPVELPSQADALAKVNADPKRRSILSKDGWVVTNRPLVQGRDESGFAKA